ITDDQGLDLPGVSILVKGTTTGTATSGDGTYSIALPDGSTTLVFSFIGYATQEIVVGSQTSINIKMASDIKTLGEVVVVGYGCLVLKKVYNLIESTAIGLQFKYSPEINLQIYFFLFFFLFLILK
ncbi:MAG TPA: carboxypeptidase-like regulatory domain-containing protein, partial [Chitinophagaceae bacterium]|nr:carboxypeptidase-like regulatory domain-containing protein [Chitinophagaceae bacterium]